MSEPHWLEYGGQSTSELLALEHSHRIDSILCALEEALQRKEANGFPLTKEEQMVLAVEALQREVNNGGFHQFFINSSCERTPMIVESLNRIGATNAAALAAEAIDALQLDAITAEAVREAADQAIVEDNQHLLDALNRCDQSYYEIGDLDQKLFAFVQSNATNIRVP